MKSASKNTEKFLNLLKRNMLLAIICITAVFIGMSDRVHAEGVTAKFGTEEGYTWECGAKSPIGFYVVDDENKNLSDVHIVVSYDPETLEFVSANEKGVTVLSDSEFEISMSGNAGKKFKKILYFIPHVSTQTSVVIKSAEAMVDGQTVAATVNTAPVTIPVAKSCEISSLWVDGQQIENFEVGQFEYYCDVDASVENVVITADAAVGAVVTVAGQYLQVGENIATVTVENRGSKAVYTIHITRPEPEPVVSEEPEESVEPTPEPSEEPVVEEVEETKEAVQSKPEIKLDNGDSGKSKGLLLIAGILAGVLVVIGIIVMAIRRFRFLSVIREDAAKGLFAGKQFGNDADEEDDAENPIAGDEKIALSAEHICKDYEKLVESYTAGAGKGEGDVNTAVKREKCRVLSDISVDIAKGEIVGILGTNGAGKSTLAEILAGVTMASTGKVHKNNRKVRLISCGATLVGGLSGSKNLYRYATQLGMDKDFAEANYSKIVEFAELDDYMLDKVENYSTGMRCRLESAIAVADTTPCVLVIDETLTSVDRFYLNKLMKRIEELVSKGSSVVMLSRSTEFLRKYCSKIIWIENGQLIVQGNVEKVCDLYDKYDYNLPNLLDVKEILEKVIEEA